MTKQQKQDYAAMRKCGYTAYVAFLKAICGLSESDRLEIQQEDDGTLPGVREVASHGPIAQLP